MIGHVSDFENVNYHNVTFDNATYDYVNIKYYLLKANYEDIFNSIKTNAQYRNIIFSSPFDIARNWEILEDTTVNYLMSIYQLKNHKQNYTDNMLNSGMWLQAYGTYVSRLTNEAQEGIKTAHNFIDPNNLKYNFVSSENALQTNEDALSYLIQKCKNERVVMINENHFTPHNRILEEIILDSLYNYGFRYLAMEAIFEDEDILNKRGFAVTHSGFYTREPMMANLIRKAIEKGYYVFGYDNFTNDREKMQALHIYQKTLAKDSMSKILVFAGFQHIDETENAKNWMAREFFLLTGINPLTIEQQKFVTEDAYLMVLDTIFSKNTGVKCDIFVANNIDYELFAAKSGYNNYTITIPEEIAKQAQSQPLMFIVSIFKAGEYQKDKTAIPVYNYVLNNELSDITIQLPTDRYCYVIKDKYGSVLCLENCKRIKE